MTTKKVKTIDITSGREIAAGGEGRIFEHPNNNHEVIKVYHLPRKESFAQHLDTLKKLPSGFIKPNEIFIDGTNKVLGFSMPYVNFSEYYLFNNLFNKGFCTSNTFPKDFKLKVLTDLANKLNEIHKSHIIIGDLNQYNVFFNKSAQVLFVDTDSYQTKDNPHSGVLLDDIRDWTTPDINTKSDVYAYDVLAFWTTTYCHPYKWVMPGNKESLEQRARQGKSILSVIPGVKIPALYEAPQGEVLKQFKEIFNDKRRYMIDFKGIIQPINVQIPTVITSNNVTIRELYKNISKVYATKNVMSIEISHGVWDLCDVSFKGICMMKRSISCDELFPAEGLKFASRIGYTLYRQDTKVDEQFSNKALWSYNEGSLAVLNSDELWNFNLANQMAGIDKTKTHVFGKSIFLRSSLIQNFGGKVCFNIPMGNTYSLHSMVLPGIKDGFYNRGHIGVEYKSKSKAGYMIMTAPRNKARSAYELDYLPAFAALNDHTIFVPDDGFIDVVTNGQVVQKYDVPMCSRSSKLYYTTAGMFLLENRVLYLINTK